MSAVRDDERQPAVHGAREDMIMKSKPKMPPFLSPELHSLLKGLLERNAMKRLGAEPSTFTQVGGVAKLKKHPFFKVV